MNRCLDDDVAKLSVAFINFNMTELCSVTKTLLSI